MHGLWDMGRVITYVLFLGHVVSLGTTCNPRIIGTNLNTTFIEALLGSSL